MNHTVKKLYAVLDIDHPMVAWEVAIGRILSVPIKDTNNVEYPTPSLWLYNNIATSVSGFSLSDFKSEIQIETIRSTEFHNSPSRFSGAFFFETRDDAEKACRMWEWESKINYISEVDFYIEGEYLKLDSNWITNEIRSLSASERTTAIRNYYNGVIYSKLEPLYEIICTGFGNVLNHDLRREAYKKIRDKYPKTSLLLAIAISCYEQDNVKYRELLRCSPYIYYNKDDDLLEGVFIIDKGALDKNEEEIGKVSKRYILKNGTLLTATNITRLGVPLKIVRPADKDILFSLGDFRPEFFTMKLSDFNEAINSAV